MELDDFVARVRSGLDVTSDDSILAFGPALRELGANKRFLARYLAEQMERPDFQSSNGYAAAVFILAEGPGFTVRVAGWPKAQDVPRTPTGISLHAYESDEAHTHTFALLTVGYHGPGYLTDLYRCDPAELQCKRPGDRVTLEPLERAQLAEGSVLYFPAFRMAHVQHPPEAYSVSLNLMVHPPNAAGFEQYFVSPSRRTLIRTGGSDDALMMLERARWLEPDAALPLLREIAATHRFQSIRRRAIEVAEGMAVRQPPGDAVERTPDATGRASL